MAWDLFIRRHCCRRLGLGVSGEVLQGLRLPLRSTLHLLCAISLPHHPPTSSLPAGLHDPHPDNFLLSAPWGWLERPASVSSCTCCLQLGLVCGAEGSILWDPFCQNHGRVAVSAPEGHSSCQVAFTIQPFPLGFTNLLSPGPL